MANIRVEIEGHPAMEFPEGTDPKVIDMVVQRDVFGKKQEQTNNAPPKGPGFIDRANEALVKRGVNIADELKPNAGDETLMGTLKQAPERALRIVGQGAGLVGDVAGEAMKGMVSTLTPESLQSSVKQGVQDILNTDIGKKGIEAAQRGMRQYDFWKRNNPNVAKDLEAVVNIGTLIPIGKGAQVGSDVAKEGVNVVSDIASVGMRKTPAALDMELTQTIRKGIEKGIRPGIAGKKTFAQTSKYFDDATNAVKDIVLNKDNLVLTDEVGEKVTGQLPKTLYQFSSAVEQTKKNLFEQFDEMAKKTGKAGITVDLQPIEDTVGKIINDVSLADKHPETIKYATELGERYKNRGAYTAQEAQKAIEVFNQDLKAFYRNPSLDTASKAYVDSEVARTLRTSLDNTIESVSGKGYQELKNKYGSLKAIEEDVNRRALVDARKNNKGLIDYTDIYIAPDILYGVLTGSPAGVAKGVFMEGIKEGIKYWNNPNRIIKSMFGDAEKIMDKKQSYTGYAPKSKMFGYVNKAQ